MKKITFVFAAIFATLLISCGSAPKPEAKSEEPAKAPAVENVQEVEEVDEVVEVSDDVQEEYLRSIDSLSEADKVSKEEFEEDKAEILEIISQLDKIMEKGDKEAWLKFIAPDSINYYSNPANIRKVQKKLSDKTIQLHGIGDYFKYVFIPSRQRSSVDEIRYISKTNVKAVDVKEDGSIVVYYYFVKVKGKWLVHLPAIA